MILLGGVVAWLFVSLATRNKFHVQCAMPLTVAAACFFVGIGLGMVLESGDSEHAADDHHAHATTELERTTAVQLVSSGESQVLESLATESNTGIQSELSARQRQFDTAGTAIVQEGDEIAGAIVSVEENVMTQRKAGVFFSIYYCMTGVHAIHILVGIGFLVWLLVRAVRQDFNPQYFGPVDYVGLYWHLVDLIWIYLFPLLYLIR
jgi:cytochrome c oxidase subunit 3